MGKLQLCKDGGQFQAGGTANAKDGMTLVREGTEKGQDEGSMQ